MGWPHSKAFSNAIGRIERRPTITRTYVDLKAYMAALKAMTGSLGARPPSTRRCSTGCPTGSPRVVGSRATPWPARWSRRSSMGRRWSPTARASSPGTPPASTLFLAEGHDVGKLVKYQLDLMRAGAMAEAFKQIDQAAAVMGGLDKLTGWIDDVGVVVTADGTTPGGGLIIVPTDVDGGDPDRRPSSATWSPSPAVRPASRSMTNRMAAGRSRRSTSATSRSWPATR